MKKIIVVVLLVVLLTPYLYFNYQCVELGGADGVTLDKYGVVCTYKEGWRIPLTNVKELYQALQDHMDKQEQPPIPIPGETEF